MRKFSLVLALFLFGPYALATPPVYGPLQAQNNLDDVDSASTSLANLGGAPLASPTFTGTVTIPSGSVLNTPASINLTNATGIPYSGLPALAANQLLGSLTATTPSGQSVPSCSASTNALLWTSGTGFGCNTSINAGTLSGATFASPGAIGGTTAAAGKFTTLQATSTITPSTTFGIIGTTLGDNANAGSVGEYISSTQPVSVSLTSGTSQDITSVSLTDGDWQCDGEIDFHPAGTTTATQYDGWISTSSASTPAAPNNGAFYESNGLSYAAGAFIAFPTGSIRENVSTTTTVFLSEKSTFAVSTNSAGGFLGCRRVR